MNQFSVCKKCVPESPRIVIMQRPGCSGLGQFKKFRIIRIKNLRCEMIKTGKNIPAVKYGVPPVEPSVNFSVQVLYTFFAQDCLPF